MAPSFRSEPAAEGHPLGRPALAPWWRRPGTWAMAWWLGELLSTVLDIALGPWTVVGFEEGRNARAALQLACGHADRLLDLQYRDFCGGCTATAIVGAPLLRVFGDAVWIWKLVPAGFHLVLVALVGRVVATHTRPLAAIGAMAVLSASPWALRELALTGWGNHGEVRALVMGSAALLLTRRHELGTSLLAGIVAGLSIWFAHISVHALPALLLLAALRRRRGLPFLLGVPAGMIPWAFYVASRPTAAEGARAMWMQGSGADPVLWGQFLLGPWHAGALWPSTGNGLLDGILATSVALVCLAAIAATFWTATRSRAPLALFVAASAGGFAIALAVRPDLWAAVPAIPDGTAFHIRYRSTLWPLVAIGAGLAVHHSPRWGGLALAPLLMVGLAARGLAWTHGPGPLRADSLVSDPGRPDATVPEGAPPRRTPWALDRRVDIEAAQAFVDTHTDPLPACRTDHLGELGRRVGLHVRRGGTATLAGLSADPAAVIRGIAWGLHAPAGRHPQRPEGTLPDAWTAPVAVARGRLRSRSDPGYAGPGACEGHAERVWWTATHGGRVPLGGPPPPSPDGCPDPEPWTLALSNVLTTRHSCPAPPGWPACSDSNQSSR